MAQPSTCRSAVLFKSTFSFPSTVNSHSKLNRTILRSRLASHAQRRRNFTSSSSPNRGKNAKTMETDYVIVGAGSAGSVLANRLTEIPTNRVTVLEAGPKDYSWKIHMPAALMYNLNDDNYNWYYHTIPQKHMNDRVMYWPRGRVWGGSSALNAMVYVRGHAYDYDRWARREGAIGWSYADCLPYFKKSQTHELGEDDYRGGGGPLHVSRGKTNNPLFRAWIDAGVEAGYPYTDDMNGYQQEGVGWMDMTIRKGLRWSTASGYLRPALKRPNIRAITKCLVTKIIVDGGKKAVGVEFVDKKGRTTTIRAEKEVILCGGSINSPQLLNLSGIGDADDLKKLDIEPVHHLPGIGQNLQDHLELYVQQACTKPVTLYSAQWKFPHNMIAIGLKWILMQKGWGASAHLEAGGFIRTEAGVPHPDVQFHFLPSTIIDHGRKTGYEHAYQVHVGPMRATSVGKMWLKSKDPREHPVLDANYLATERDRWEFRRCIRLSREIFAQNAFAPFRGRELAPGDAIRTDDQLDAYVRANADSAYHPSCTCKMGSPDDPLAVTDHRGKVLGMESLRIVDASIMPSVVSGNLNGPVVMMAEKLADVVKGETPLPPSRAPVWEPKTLMETQRGL